MVGMKVGVEVNVNGGKKNIEQMKGLGKKYGRNEIKV
jgi:hypothetical protein